MRKHRYPTPMLEDPFFWAVVIGLLLAGATF